MTYESVRAARVASLLLVSLGIPVTVCGAGCSKRSDAPPAAATPSPVAAGSSAPAPPATDTSAAPQPPSGGLALTLADRLAAEARNRPRIQPNADDVLTAFAKIGGAVANKKQGLGATYSASFCEGGTTTDGAVTMSICEYPDGDATKAGLAALETIYPAKQAKHVMHKDTVLTTLRLQDGPAAQALETKLVAAYAAL
jgi:hypothetical protein